MSGKCSRITALLSLLLLLQSFAHSTHIDSDTKATEPDKIRIGKSVGKLPLYFIENQGQVHKDVSYYVKGADKTLFFTKEGVTFVLTGKEGKEPKRWAVKLAFVGPAPNVKPKGKSKQKTVFSYFKGKPKDWKTGVPAYSRLTYENLWPGIDLVYSGSVNQLKYEFVVKPGADPKQIRLSYQGAKKVEVSESGELLVTTPVGGFSDAKPYAYQEVEGEVAEVFMEYAPLKENQGGSFAYGFHVENYDKKRTLILDPAMLISCGYIGGSSVDYGYGIAVDGDGAAYVTGSTYSIEATFPVIVGPDLTFSGGSRDGFVAKVNPSGTSLSYCGYIGGSSVDYGYGIAVDGGGAACVTGLTSSYESSFPVIVGPDLTYNGGPRDSFVAKVNPAGTSLSYCGYIGGNSVDHGYGIAVDGDGAACVTGLTSSYESSFPVIVGPDLTYNGGAWDGFVAKVNPSGTSLSYCGYIGGSSVDHGYGIAVDGDGAAYVTGLTYSFQSTFPVIAGPDLTYNGGSSDGFVAKVNPSGTSLSFCGYIGGSSGDHGYGIAVDGDGAAYVTGLTYSFQWSFPVIVGPDLTFNGGSRDGFVAKVNPSGQSLSYCGYIGGSSVDHGYGIAVDGGGAAYVTGLTYSFQSTFPVIVGPDLTYNGGSDTFVAKVPSYHVLLRRGNVNAGAGDAANVLFLNGGTGDNSYVYKTSAGSAITLTMEPPPSGPNPAAFALYFIQGEAGLSDVQNQGFFIGTACMPLPVGNGHPYPPPYTLANSIGYQALLGTAILGHIGPAPRTVLNLPAGLSPGIYTFQGYIFDQSAISLTGLSLTNAIVLKVQ